MKPEYEPGRYKAGDTVWLVPTGNNSRIYRSTPLPVESTVVSVKRKYFYVKKNGSSYEEKFDIATGENVSEDCNAGWELWPTRQSYLDEKERRTKLQECSRALRTDRAERSLGLDHVRAIYDVLDGQGFIRHDG